MTQNVALIFFPTLMIFSALSDFLTMTIPNRVSIMLVIGYFALSIWLGAPLEIIALHVACGLLVLACAFVAFLRGWIGGGDAKLAAATALWIGWENLIGYGVLSSFAGGLLTLVIMAVGWCDFYEYFRSIPFARRLAEKVNCVPYGIALAIGGLLVYPHTEIWRQLSTL